MSDDDDSMSGSGSEDLSTTGLIATRAKRATAGNLYATLRQNLDDEELQKELLAEDEEDQGDYQGSDKDDDDAMSSSSDEDDAGPPKEGEKEDLEGEKELKKAERAEARKKRKMEEVKMRLPAWQKKKKVKLADDSKAEDGAAERPKKKSERSNWLPTAADAPIRQSSRASAIANRESIHENLKESLIRSEKQKKIMARHNERTTANKRADLTQEERLAKAVRIEKETAREFGRWEREEAERQRIREEQLAAKRRRGIDGPVMRYWSGSVMWEGEKIKIKRMHGSQNVDEIKDEPKPEEKKDDQGDVSMADSGNEKQGQSIAVSHPSLPATVAYETPSNEVGAPAQASAPVPAQPPQPPQNQMEVGWLAGIQEYASQTNNAVQASSNPTGYMANPYTPSAPAINAAPNPPPLAPQPAAAPLSGTNPPSSQTPICHAWPPGYQEFTLQQPTAPAPQPEPAPAPPLIKEQAQRSLIMLEQFENLENTTTSKRGASKASKDSLTDPSPLASTLLPSSYPSFTPEETRYLTTKMRKRANDLSMPVAPTKAKCALTCWPAKFRDPKTGLPYHDLQTFKMVQRLLMGGCQWSAILGAWVGPHYGATGRAAKGVPEGFGEPVAEKKKGDEGSEVKVEG
ncbi:hypothetical protein M409DRAFT_55800 [Zasmidium cellare ATCC 36951]|uniref:Vps72/YL1 C-terminal domain-containing protein n=1 Tax=Zasmidium cellare ATCC 36951 TaxID=1080233 RepID=A0A6A6CDT4_ZASCE|nr:uncharacterized protein M409DRAFT_55800 [Zasmidium cellare ATCC 36951]KAF2165397.1 hypothetical protein M409DRAFT_55800 [Zasmidium cellare ATCC 36951]